MALQTRRFNVVANALKSNDLTWDGLVHWSGLAALVVLGGVAVIRGDLEAGMVAAGFAISSGLLRFRGGSLGRIGIGLLSAVTLFFMSTAAITNGATGSPQSAVLLSSGLAAITFAGLASAIGSLAGRKAEADDGAAPRYAAWASLLLFVGLWGWSLIGVDPAGPVADASLVAKNVAFSEGALSVAAGEVTVAMSNQDLFWHTFTIDSLGVDLPVPVGATRSVTFEVEPGTYEFKCRIPGHPEAGMVGIISVAG